ncbi:unnamed protein product, partial [Symbiodinium necroappetens]
EYCLLCGKGATAGHLATENHSKAMASWERRGRPQLIISPERFSDNERLQMCLQGYLLKFSDEQIRVVQERVLQTEWYQSQGKYQGPVPLESEIVPGESSAAPSKSLTTGAGIWTAEPPPIKGKTASSGTPVAKEKATSSGTPVVKEKATSSGTPVAKEKATSSATPVAKEKITAQRATLGSVGTTGSEQFTASSEQLGRFGRTVGTLGRKTIVDSPASYPSEGFGVNGTGDATESGGIFTENGIFSESSGIFSKGSVFTEGGGTEGGGTSSASTPIISAAYPYGATTSTGGGPLPVGANELCGCPAQGNSIQPMGGELSRARDDGTYYPARAGALDASPAKLDSHLAPSAPSEGATGAISSARCHATGNSSTARSPSPSTPPAVPGPMPMP